MELGLATLLAALDHTRVGVHAIAVRGGVVERLFVNRYGASRIGYSVEDMPGDWLDTVAEHERPRVFELMARISAGEVAPAVLEVQLRHRDGQVVPSEVSATQIDLPDGALIVCLVRDLAYDTHSLEALRMAVVGALAAGIAHEINNPLTYVLLHLRSLRRSIDEWAGANAAEAARRLDEAYAGAERIRAIVRSVMTFAASPGAPTDVDLGAVVESALRLARPELESRARVVCQMFPVEPVRADEPRLGQAVLSMLLFASAGFPGDDPTLNRIVVAVEMRDGQVAYEVTDNGRDLAPDDLARVVDPAFVVRSHGDAPGFGLGMARAIAMAAGGRLVIAARPGGGVVATLSLPAVAVEPQAR